MPWDYELFHLSGARNGMTVITPSATNTVRISGNNLEPRTAGHVRMATCVTAAIANLVGWRFRETQQTNYARSTGHSRDQTGAVDGHNLMFLAYPFGKDAILQAEADNGNNAQVESVQMALAYGTDPLLGLQPRFVVPDNSGWIDGQGGTAAVANVWTESAVTWNFTFKRDINYAIIGMMAYSATGYAGRLIFPAGEVYRPGVPAGDTNLLNQPIYGHFGTFKGQNPPNLEICASGTDATQQVKLLISPMVA